MATTTAQDTLKAKTKDGSVISGGHLVAKALKSEGVDTIFTLCGGHIIDIYDGCIDEGIRIIWPTMRTNTLSRTSDSTRRLSDWVSRGASYRWLMSYSCTYVRFGLVRSLMRTALIAR